MKRFLVASVLAGLVAGGAAYAADPELKTDDEKILYALGFDLSSKLSVFKLTPAEVEILKAGLTDAVNKRTARVDMPTYAPKINDLIQARQAAGAAEEKKKGKAFLDTIAAKPNIKKNISGMLFESIKEGTGKSPAATDKVKVNYKGTLIDGTVFDSSEKHGGPATFSLTEVYKCWVEGLPMMKTGGKAKLYCPSDMAEGNRGRGIILPGATVVFEVELLEIVK